MTDQEEKLIFKSGCTSNSNKIYSILKNLEYLPIKKATEQESIERAEALPQIDNYQIHLIKEQHCILLHCTRMDFLCSLQGKI